VVQPIFCVPFTRDPKFIGRGEIIKDISTRFESQKRVALAGIGGIGYGHVKIHVAIANGYYSKSQIAIEFCYRFHKQHPTAHVLWVHASTQQRIDEQFRRFGKEASLPGFDDPKVNVVKLVLDWLVDDSSRSWLLVLDNADDLHILVTQSKTEDSAPPLIFHLTHSSNGYILVTTRDQRVGRKLASGKPILILPMNQHESEQLLDSNLEEDFQSNTQSDRKSQESKNELLLALGHIPLAIKTATAYINTMGITINQYLDILSTKDEEAQLVLSHMDYDERRDHESLNSIVRTWIISFDQIDLHEPRAAELLSLMSMFDQYKIPKMLLTRENEPESTYIAGIGVLRSFAFITFHDGDTYDIHRLVRLSAHKWLDFQDKRKAWLQNALFSVKGQFPWPAHDNLNACARLLPHAVTVAQQGFMTDADNLALANLQSKIGEYLELRGQYILSYKSKLNSFEIYKKVQGNEHRDTLSSLNNLGNVLNSLGNYKEAEEAHRQCLMIRKKVLGDEHPDTLSSLNNLGSVLNSLGNYKEAEEAHRQCLKIRKKVLGDEHPDTLSSLSNFGTVLSSLGNYEEAEEAYHQCLKIRKMVLGDEHPDTLISLNNLGTVLNNQKKYEEAEEAHRQCLKIRKKVLGDEHFNTLSSLSNFGTILSNLGNYKEAEEAHRQCLNIRKKLLGYEHPSTLQSMSYLGDMLMEVHQYDKAESLLTIALEVQKRVLGLQHPDTQWTACRVAEAQLFKTQT
jgi:tetratricopeptide (TPR) repeat protein